MNEPEKDEREGLPSGSSMERHIECPGSWQLSRIVERPPVNDWAEAGARVAALIENLERGEPLPEDADEEEVETAQMLVSKKASIFASICEKNGLDPEDFDVYHEQRLWWYSETVAGNLFSGKLDTYAVHRSLPVAIILDDKSGWLKQPMVGTNWQLRAYAVLVIQNHADRLFHPNVKVHVSTVTRFWDEPATFEMNAEDRRLSISNFQARISATLLSVVPARPYEHGLFSGEWCRYCPAILECPVQRRELTNLQTFEPATISGKLASMTNDNLELILDAVEQVKFIGNAANNEATGRLKEDPAALKGWVHESGPPRRQSVNIAAAFEAVKERGITFEEFCECIRADGLSVSKTGKLEKLIYAKAAGELAHKEADAWMVGALTAKNALTEKTPEPSLKRKK